MHKYYLDENDTIKVDRHTLKRVIYTQEFLDSLDLIKNKNDVDMISELLMNENLKNELKNSRVYIESYDNLSQKGLCVAYGNAKIFESARVYGDATVYGNARIYGFAQVYDNSEVTFNAEIFEYALVFGYAQIYDNARVYGKAKVHESSLIRDNVRIYGQAEVYGETEAYNNVRLFGCTRIKDSLIKGNTWVYRNVNLFSYNNSFVEVIGVEKEECKECEFYNKCYHFN